MTAMDVEAQPGASRCGQRSMGERGGGGQAVERERKGEGQQ